MVEIEVGPGRWATVVEVDGGHWEARCEDVVGRGTTLPEALEDLAKNGAWEIVIPDGDTRGGNG